MVSHITGIIKRSNIQQQIIVDMGMIALTVHVPDTALFDEEKSATLFIRLEWHQDNGPTLYGFVQEIDRAAFDLIKECSGVGAKLALSVLSDLGVERFIDSVQTGNEKILSSVNGIGTKKAEQMIVYLKHKIEKLVPLMGSSKQSHYVALLHDVAQALTALDYSRSEVNRAINQIKNDASVVPGSFDQIFRQALSYLTK